MSKWKKCWHPCKIRLSEVASKPFGSSTSPQTFYGLRRFFVFRKQRTFFAPSVFIVRKYGKVLLLSLLHSMFRNGRPFIMFLTRPVFRPQLKNEFAADGLLPNRSAFVCQKKRRKGRWFFGVSSPKTTGSFYTFSDFCVPFWPDEGQKNGGLIAFL